LDSSNENYWLDAIFLSLAFHKGFLEANNNLIGSHPTVRKRHLTLFLTVQSNVKFNILTIEKWKRVLPLWLSLHHSELLAKIALTREIKATRLFSNAVGYQIVTSANF